MIQGRTREGRCLSSEARVRAVRRWGPVARLSRGTRGPRVRGLVRSGRCSAPSLLARPAPAPRSAGIASAQIPHHVSLPGWVCRSVPTTNGTRAKGQPRKTPSEVRSGSASGHFDRPSRPSDFGAVGSQQPNLLRTRLRDAHVAQQRHLVTRGSPRRLPHRVEPHGPTAHRRASMASSSSSARHSSRASSPPPKRAGLGWPKVVDGGCPI